LNSSSPSPSNQLWESEREGKEEGNSSIFLLSMLCNGLKVISRLQFCSQFIFQLNYENDVKNMTFEIIFTKIINNEKFDICYKIMFKK